MLTLLNMLAGECKRLYVVFGASSAPDFQNSWHRNECWFSTSRSKMDVYDSPERFRWRPCHLLACLSGTSWLLLRMLFLPAVLLAS